VGAMAQKWVFKLVEISVAAGATVTDSWAFDGDYVLHPIPAVDQEDAALYECTVTVKVADKILTKEAVPGVFFTPSELGALDFDVDVVKGERIEFGVTNNRTVSVTARFVLELIPKG